MSINPEQNDKPNINDTKNQPQKLLVDSERFAQETINALTAHIAVLDEKGFILAVNEAWQKFALESPGTLEKCGVGSNYLSLWKNSNHNNTSTGNLRSELLAIGIEDVIRGQLPVYELLYPSNSGKEKLWFNLRVSRFSGQVPIRVVVARENVTQQVLATEKQAFLASIVTSSKDAIISQTLDSIITSWNKGAENLFGYSPEEAIGQFTNILLPESEKQEINLGTLKTAITYECYRKTKDNRLIPVSITLSPMYSFSGKIIGFSKVARDISEHKNQITQLEQIQGQLQVAKQLAENASHAKGEFLANMSHEIRTPMNAIIGLTDLLSETQLSQEQRFYLNNLSSSANMLLEIINDILDFSKIEAGKLRLQEAPLELRNFLSDLLKALAERAHKKGLDLIQIIDINLPDKLIAIPVRLQQVIVNLVGNAIKFTDQGHVMVTVKSLEEIPLKDFRPGYIFYLQFSIEDTGIGISKDKQEMIFAPFEQADSSNTRRYGGTGLGLAISNRLVKLMQGKIWLESTPNQGSIFHFIVPCKVMETEASYTFPTYNLRKRPVFIVTKHSHHGKYLSSLLRHWDMEYFLAQDLESAIEIKLTKNQPSILLLDHSLADTADISLINKAKELFLAQHIVIMAPFTHWEKAFRYKSLGINQFLGKPFKQEELLEKFQQFATVKIPTIKPSNDSIKSLNILLTEDDEMNQMVFLRQLSKRGHIVKIANNGLEALKALEKETFDLILMDLQMPVMDGLEATEEIRKREKNTNAHTPIIMLTASVRKEDEEKGFLVGVDAYLNKPLNLELLTQTIKKLLENNESITKTNNKKTNRLIIDLQELQEIYGEDKEVISVAANGFISNIAKLLSETVSAISRQDKVLLSITTHKLKNLSLQLAAQELLNITKELEDLAHKSAFSEAKTLFSKLEIVVEKTKQEIRKLNLLI
ncbi:MAG: response regulator [Acidobacteria bacterium]|nr:response regulator [Acidobacteriota bacterium]